MKRPLSIAISGSHGLVGSHLWKHFAEEGHTLCRLVRGQFSPPDIGYDVERRVVDGPGLEKMDIIIHLAGKNLVASRWNERIKEELRKSRIESTKLLGKALARTEGRPKVFLCASAVGYYGDHGSQWVDEKESAGNGFLAELCRDWEDATHEASLAGIRVVNMRFGHVLAEEGGLLKALCPVFRLGLGGKLGNGQQYMSFIAMNDLVRAVSFIVEHEEIFGPVNMSAPNPVTNREFTETLAKVLKRPAFFSVPKGIMHMLMGDASTALFESCRAIPKVLLERGFSFEHDTLEKALRAVL